MKLNTVTEHEAQCREYAAYWRGHRDAIEKLVGAMETLKAVVIANEDTFKDMAEKAKIESALKVAPSHPGTERLVAAIGGAE